MDVVVETLEATTIGTNNINTSYDALYKNWGKLGNQEERRINLLEVQKSNRNSNLDKVRGILELITACEEGDYFEPHKKVYYRPSIYVAGFNKAPSYDKLLMMSEWMIERPSDFEENWVVVASPKGHRVLVIASNGSTRVFSKHGNFMFECRTALPGGSSSDPKSKKNCCVLDCFYEKKNNTMHVLDILGWNSQHMTDGELEFRDYWLRSHFFELDALRVLNKKNQLVFSILPKVSCAPEYFNTFMMKVHFKPTAGDVTTLDGLLFYHKKARYFSGETPLVGWLYPYMVPEVLGNHITVNPAYMIQKPDNYTNQADYIVEFNTKLDRKNKRKFRNTSKMDMSELQTVHTNAQESNLRSAESMDAEAASVSSETNKVAVEVKGAQPIIGDGIGTDTFVDEATAIDVDTNSGEKVVG